MGNYLLLIRVTTFLQWTVELIIYVQARFEIHYLGLGYD